MALRLVQPFILPRSNKWVPGTPVDSWISTIRRGHKFSFKFSKYLHYSRWKFVYMFKQAPLKSVSDLLCQWTSWTSRISDESDQHFKLIDNLFSTNVLSYKNQLAGLQSNQLTGFYIRGTFIANMLMWIKNERCEKMDDTFFVYIPFSYNMVVNFTWHNTHYKPFHRNTSPLPINRFSFCSSLHTM